MSVSNSINAKYRTNISYSFYDESEEPVKIIDPDDPVQLVFENLNVKATHMHHGVAMARLYYSTHHEIHDSRYCSGCLPLKMPFHKKLRYHVYCPECKVYTPLFEGPHIWCIECSACARSRDAHWFYHEPGDCKACTDVDDDIPHSWCSICRECRPFTELHEHEDNDLPLWRYP